MRKVIRLICSLIIILPVSAHALLSMELTRGVAGAIPIAVVPFSVPNDPFPQDVSKIISNDLQNSGRFKVFGRSELHVFPSDAREVSATYFRRLGTDNVVVGKINRLDQNQYKITFQLLTMYRGQGEKSLVLDKSYTVSVKDLRPIAHHISDLIHQELTGIKGIFSTKIAYVVVQPQENKKTHYSLEVSDQDGYNPRSLLISEEPIMSPAWSPDAKKIAYVSFENQRAGIYVHDVRTGERKLISEFPGINGAPAWSPEGKKLAIVLSKNGSPNIYIMDINNGHLTQVTNDFYINTEPAWAANGKSLMFTSNRSGGPQIYQINLASRAISRISYDGKYNARASFAKDGRKIAIIHRVSGIYNIALLNLNNGTTRVLTTTGDSASPSIAPNGSMILYDTVYRGRNMLAMVSVDGRIQLILPPRQGEAQDPAWSPFLS